LLVCLRKEARKLPLWRCNEFLYGDDKADFSGSLLFLERKMMQQSELFGDILLSKFPIAHKTLRPKIAVQLMNGIRDRRILGCVRTQVNEAKENDAAGCREWSPDSG
jgi:hypothetical protein